MTALRGPVKPAQPPMMTVSEQGGRILPAGAGSGATHEGKATRSPALAAGFPPINTVIEPCATMPGPAGTQEISMQGAVVELTVAAGKDSISTVGTQFKRMGSGSGGWATGVGTGAGGWMGAWQCGPEWIALSLKRAAPGINRYFR